MDTNKRRQILERIAKHVRSQDSDALSHHDCPVHNSHADSAIYSEYVTKDAKPEEEANE